MASSRLSLSLSSAFCAVRIIRKFGEEPIFSVLGFQFQRQGVFRLFVTLPSEKEREEREIQNISNKKQRAAPHESSL